MTRLELFGSALANTRALKVKFPTATELASIEEQLVYVIGVASGSVRDLRPLERINFGVIAARSVDDMDDAAGELIHQAAAEARKMQSEHAGQTRIDGTT